MAVAEVAARRRQKPGEIPPLWSRILASAALAAPAGWLGDHAFWVFGLPFLVLRYCIRPKREPE